MCAYRQTASLALAHKHTHTHWPQPRSWWRRRRFISNGRVVVSTVKWFRVRRTIFFSVVFLSSSDVYVSFFTIARELARELRFALQKSVDELNERNEQFLSSFRFVSFSTSASNSFRFFCSTDSWHNERIYWIVVSRCKANIRKNESEVLCCHFLRNSSIVSK